MPTRPTLYAPTIVQHAKNPQHTTPVAEPTHQASVSNLICGDRITLELRLQNGHIQAVSHRTRGCALCIASASLMSNAILNQPVSSLQAQHDEAQDFVNQLPDTTSHPIHQHFLGLKAAPARKGCVLLPWQALLQALD